jgi:flagellar protein FlaJ
MRFVSALLLAACGLMWFAVLLQNMVLFFSSIFIFLILVSLNVDRSAAKSKLQILFSYLKFLLSKILKDNSTKLDLSTNNKIMKMVKPILKNKTITLLQRKINSEIEQEIRVSGKACNPRILANQSIAYMIFSFFITVPISIVLGLFASPYLFLMLLVCPLWLYYPKLKLWFIVSERKSSIDSEMAFFTLYAGVMQSIGQSLYNSIIDVLGRGIFPTIESEAKMLSRNVQVFGMDQITALNEHGYSHPNFYFKNLLLGYSSISKSGGNLSLYMERKSEEFFQKTQFKYANYKSQANIIGETMLILLTILPTMILVSSFMLAEDSVKVIMGLAFILIPGVTIFITLMIDLSQPRTRNIVNFNFKSIFVSIFFSTVLLLLGQQLWFVIGVGVVAGAIFNFVSCLKQFREISCVDSVLPDFLRDITEYRKIGIPIPNAIIKVSEDRCYNKYFDGLLTVISGRLKHGISLSDIFDSVLIRSWTAKTSFFVLGKIADSGGGTAQILEQITNFSTNINQIKKETLSSLSVISYFTFLSPIMITFTAKEMAGVLEKLNPALDQMVQGAFSIETMLVSTDLIEAINILNVISAISLGLVISKLVYFSMKDTITLGMMVLISVLSITFSPFFPSFVKI